MLTVEELKIKGTANIYHHKWEKKINRKNLPNIRKAVVASGERVCCATGCHGSELLVQHIALGQELTPLSHGCL